MLKFEKNNLKITDENNNVIYWKSDWQKNGLDDFYETILNTVEDMYNPANKEDEHLKNETRLAATSFLNYPLSDEDKAEIMQEIANKNDKSIFIDAEFFNDKSVVFEVIKNWVNHKFSNNDKNIFLK